jgi:hypothetical protein
MLVLAFGAQAEPSLRPLSGKLSPKQQGMLERFSKGKQYKKMQVIGLDAAVLKSESFSLDLFEQNAIKATRSRTASEFGATVYAGKLSKSGLHGEFIFSFMEDDFVGKLTLGGETYRIRNLGDGAFVLEQNDQANLPECGQEAGK